MRFILTWLILAGLWIGLSGYFDVIHLTWGVVAVTLVASLSSRHLLGDVTLGRGIAGFVRLAVYTPWLIRQIVEANWDVLLRVLGRRPVDPSLVRFDPGLGTDFGRVTLANSITLTPGTVTVEIEEDGHFLVHAVAPDVAEGLATSGMVQRVQQVEGLRS